MSTGPRSPTGSVGSASEDESAVSDTDERADLEEDRRRQRRLDDDELGGEG
jgi:hypothetical protein